MTNCVNKRIAILIFSLSLTRAATSHRLVTVRTVLGRLAFHLFKNQKPVKLYFYLVSDINLAN